MYQMKFIFLLLTISLMLNCHRASYKFVMRNVPEQKHINVEIKNSSLNSTFPLKIDLLGTELNLNYNITWFHKDTIRDDILIMGVESDTSFKQVLLFAINTKTNKIKWEKNILKYEKLDNKEFYPVFITHDRIIFKVWEFGATGGYHTFALNRDSGEIVWDNKGNTSILNEELGLMFNIRRFGISLFDINSGMIKWTRKTNYNPIEFENHIRGNTWFAGNDGIHAYNLDDGQGWDIVMHTYARDIAKLILSSNTTPSGHITPSAPLNVYSFLTSNLCFIDNKVFSAGFKIIVGADETSGQEIWRNELSNSSAHSFLYEAADGNLGMISEGWCYKDGNIINYTLPYLALFAKESGKQLKYMPIKSKSRVIDHFLTNKEIFILTPENIILFDENYNLVKQFDLKRKDELEKNTNKAMYFINEDEIEEYFFVSDTANVKYQVLSDYGKSELSLWVMGSDGIFHLNSDLEVEDWFPNDHIFKKVYSNNNLFYLKSLKKTDEGTQNNLFTVITDQRHAPLGELKFEGEYDFIGNSLYISDGKQLKVIKLP